MFKIAPYVRVYGLFFKFDRSGLAETSFKAVFGVSDAFSLER